MKELVSEEEGTIQLDSIFCESRDLIYNPSSSRSSWHMVDIDKLLLNKWKMIRDPEDETVMFCVLR